MCNITVALLNIINKKSPYYKLPNEKFRLLFLIDITLFFMLGLFLKTVFPPNRGGE